MAYFSFTARRSLTSGTSAGDTVSFYVDLQGNDARVEPIKTEHRSIGGRTVTRIDRIDSEFDVVTVPLMTNYKNDRMVMFLNSVIAGEVFLANLDSNSGGGAISMRLVKTYTKERIYQNILVYNFTIRAA